MINLSSDSPSLPNVLREESELKRRIKNVKAVVLDWDGVFNDGLKDHEIRSQFSEPDSMGINLLRYMLWKQNGELPKCFVITGQGNAAAKYFCERENFHGLVQGALYKKDVYLKVCKDFNFEPDESIFFFDDVLDLNVCRLAGIRAQILHGFSPLFDAFVISNELTDLVSTVTGGQHAIRQLCDYLLYISGLGEEVIQGRMDYHGSYSEYINDRKQVKPRFY
jgi:3-deoxy-D-manno-octulosonate 8-phosphate phosphatase (KDO 8-P phosphatase)